MKINALLEAYKRETDRKVGERILMIVGLNEGKSSYSVGEQFHCPHSKVLYWKHRFEKDGIAGLRTKPRSGRSPKMTKKKAEHIKHVIRSRAGWRTAAIRELIRKEAGITYSERHIIRLMHAWGFEKIKQRSY